MAKYQSTSDNFTALEFMQTDATKWFKTSWSNLKSAMGNDLNVLGWEVSYEADTDKYGFVRLTTIKNDGNPGFNSILAITATDSGSTKIKEGEFFPQYLKNKISLEKMGFYFISSSVFDFASKNDIVDFIFSISVLDLGENHSFPEEDFIQLIPILKIECIFGPSFKTVSAPRVILAAPCPTIWRPSKSLERGRVTGTKVKIGIIGKLYNKWFRRST